VPAAVAGALGKRLPRAAVQVVAGAGHAPFLSDPAGFVAAVQRFAGGQGRGAAG
jgi:pimeloyl-ACP methyl ester carboxylesterase